MSSHSKEMAGGALGPKDQSVYGAVVARINYLAEDREDLQPASKECSLKMSNTRIHVGT